MYNNNPSRVLTGEVRLSYANLVEPKPNKNDPNGTPKYSVTLLIPKAVFRRHQILLVSVKLPPVKE